MDPMPSGVTQTRIGVKLLVIAPDQSRLAAVSSRLSGLGFACDGTLSSPAAMRRGLLQAPDVIVAVEIPGSWQPGRQLLEMEMSHARPVVPVLVISDGVAPAERANALASRTSGIWDWVEVSCPDREMAARIMRLDGWKRMSDELEDLRRRCAEMETVDRLTGLPNHRAFQEYVTVEFRRAERYQSPLSLILFDIDRFRSLNDTHGHLWGDRVLQAVARGLRMIVREVDMAARYGGEEFALVLPATDAKAALAVATRLRAMIEEIGAKVQPEAQPGVVAEGPSRITVSAGVATWPDEGTATRGLLLAAAEGAMRRAKDEGRNRIVAYSAGAAPAQTKTTGASGGPRWSG